MQISPSQTTVGFIGLGVMGRSMAQHLLDVGYALIVHTRTRSKAEPLLEAGAKWAESPAELAPQCDVIITIVGFPEDVEAVYLGADGLIAQARPGSVLIDMTTSSPLLAERLGREAGERELEFLDAPVSGGDIGAREARLSIMAGGSEQGFERVRPLFEIMGKNIHRQGPAGAGQHTKMANQIAVAGTMLGTCEALAYAQFAGLDPEQVLQSIGGGAAASWSLNHLGPRIIQEDFAPGFYVKHFIKDMRLAINAARETGCATPALDLTLAMYEQLAKEGHADDGTQVLARLYETGRKPEV